AGTARPAPDSRWQSASALKAARPRPETRCATGCPARSPGCQGCSWATIRRLGGLDDVFSSPGPQPVLAQQPPHLRGGVLIEARRMLGIHTEDLVHGLVR